MRIVYLALAACAWLLVPIVFDAAPAPAQAPAADEQHIPVEELKPGDRDRLGKLRDGRIEVTAGDQPILQRAARWHIYRLTWKKFQEREPDDPLNLSSGRSSYDLLQQELYPLLIVPDPRKGSPYRPTDNQQKYMQEFTKALIPPIEKVLKNPRPIARINAAIVLTKMSESGQELLAKPLASILADKDQIDAVKFYALVGLKNVFSGDPAQEKEVRATQTLTDRDVERDAIQKLLDFLTRPANFTDTTTQGEKDAFHYLRREAIRALGQTRWPGYPAASGRSIAARTAWELFRIVREQDVEPAPTLGERVEAAVAICQLKSRLLQPYLTDYALAHLGQFFVDIADQYERERIQAGAPGGTSHPWKLYGALLEQAAQTLADDLKSKPQAQQMLALARNMFHSIAVGNQATGLRELRGWLKDHPTQEKQLYRTDEKSTLKDLPSGG
jgi:hypothetical protein